MNATQLFRDGRLKDAIEALGAEVRQNPADPRRRTFLFELLCFAGEYERARKHLNVLAKANPEAEVGAVLYLSALAAEQIRQDRFTARQFPPVPAETGAAPRAGVLNGKPFRTFEDADPRIGNRLEAFVAGEYLWLPFEHIGSIRMEPPKQLRDLMWASAVVTAGPDFKGKELGEVLLPVLCPLSWQHPSDAVKLGRETQWQASDGETVPAGQKLFVVDGEEVISLLEIRELEFVPSGESKTDSASGTAV